jgi:hypothetical protein
MPLTERIQAHVGRENKRKNLVGEGFEDTVAALLRRVPGVASTHEVRVRPRLSSRPAWLPPSPGHREGPPGRPGSRGARHGVTHP